MGNCSPTTPEKPRGYVANPFLLSSSTNRNNSHLMGLFYRTLRIVENGIKPAYVFDGKPPELKAGVVSTYIPLEYHLAETLRRTVIKTVRETTRGSRRQRR